MKLSLPVRENHIFPLIDCASIWLVVGIVRHREMVSRFGVFRDESPLPRITKLADACIEAVQARRDRAHPVSTACSIPQVGEESMMGRGFDDFVKGLQTQIFEETKQDYGDAAFKRWLKPLYVGGMDDPDGYGRVAGSCGDTMEIFLKFENDKVKKATFQTDGCGSSTICGSFAAELSLGKSPDEILDITGEAILEKAGGLPEGERHCAFLSAEAVHEALHAYMIKQNKSEGSR